MRNCFNCHKTYTLHGYEGMHCKDSDKCDNCSLWEPQHTCKNCAFREYRTNDDFSGICNFKEDKQAESFTIKGKKFYKSSNKYPTKRDIKTGYYCGAHNDRWAWKLDPETLE